MTMFSFCLLRQTQRKILSLEQELRIYEKKIINLKRRIKRLKASETGIFDTYTYTHN